jgi:hypothetical protein
VRTKVRERLAACKKNNSNIWYGEAQSQETKRGRGYRTVKD